MTSEPLQNRREQRKEAFPQLRKNQSYEIASDALVGSPTDIEVVFIGPVGIGKTTAVKSLSSILPVNTEAKATYDGDFYSNWKTTTTVGIDYGMWKPTPELTVGLFGVAGQDRFHDARTALTNPEAGIVLWLYGTEELAEEQLESWAELLNDPKKRSRLCIAVNFVEDGGTARLIHGLEKMGCSDVPVVVADPRVREDVEAVVVQILTLLDFDLTGNK